MRHLSCPQYPGLFVNDFWVKSREFPLMEEYWPEERDRAALPRQFVINVLYSVVGEAIALWTHNVIEEQNQRVAENRSLLIELDPEIARAF